MYEGRTLFKFPSSRAYSSRTSCSRGESVSSEGDGGVVCEAERCVSGGSEDMVLSCALVCACVYICKALECCVGRCSARGTENGGVFVYGGRWD